MPTHRCIAVAFFAVLLICTNSARAQTPTSAPAAASFRRPELVAIAWTSSKVGSNPQTAVQEGLQPWRPDHSPISDDETRQIKTELRQFGSPGRIEDETLPPLHLVFRIDDRAHDSQILSPSLIVGQRRIESRTTQEGSSPQHLALAVVLPSRRALAAWPAEIDLELKVPIEESATLRTIKPLAEAPVDVDPGVRLFWAMTAGMNRSGQKVFPAVALSIDHGATPLADYDFLTHLADGTAESFNSSQFDGGQELRLSPPLDSKEAVAHIDVTRLRYRVETYRGIPIYPERLARESKKPTP